MDSPLMNPLTILLIFWQFWLQVSLFDNVTFKTLLAPSYQKDFIYQYLFAGFSLMFVQTATSREASPTFWTKVRFFSCVSWKMLSQMWRMFKDFVTVGTDFVILSNIGYGNQFFIDLKIKELDKTMKSNKCLSATFIYYLFMVQ